MNTPITTTGLPEWNIGFLTLVPRIESDPERSVDGVEALFFEGAPWKGKPTRGLGWIVTGRECGPKLDVPNGMASATLPAATTVCYLNF